MWWSAPSCRRVAAANVGGNSASTMRCGMFRMALAVLLTLVGPAANNPGNLAMVRHVPDGLPAGRPVVVALHGCTQTASTYGTGSGWVELADRLRFTVLLPEQQTSNNISRCFNWFERGDTT